MQLTKISIGSRRLRLLPIDHGHAEDIFHNFTAEITLYMFPSPPDAISDTLAFIDHARETLQDGSALQVAITDKTSGEFLGCAGLAGIGRRDPELGLWLKKTVHGNGYGLETISAMIDWARSNIDFEYLRYPVDKRNTASRRIAERNGGVASLEYHKTNRSGHLLDEVEYWIFR